MTTTQPSLITTIFDHLKGVSILFFFLWIGLIVYALFLAPPIQPSTLDTIIQMLTFNLQEINPLIFAIFNLMAIWPLIYAGVMLIDGKGQKIPAWPFALLSFGIGAFSILPYLVLRKPNREFREDKDRIIKIVDSPYYGIIILIITIGLVLYGVLLGNFTAFFTQFQTDRFIAVMTLDFIILTVCIPYLIFDDMKRRLCYTPRLFLIFTVIPLLGPALYLATRPALLDAN
ncbi:MAG: DUF2834 domain-containing protein [Candidatus Hermodarchaeota archaeon]